MEDFGKIYGPAFIAKKAWRVSRVNNFFYSFELLKITKQVLTKSIKKNGNTKIFLKPSLIFFNFKGNSIN